MYMCVYVRAFACLVYAPFGLRGAVCVGLSAPDVLHRDACVAPSAPRRPHRAIRRAPSAPCTLCRTVCDGGDGSGDGNGNGCGDDGQPAS
jgi:hypothetical protein